MVGVVVVDEAGQPLLERGEPVIRHVLLRAEDTRVIDTWNVSGLRGTGSHDLAAEDVIVSRRWSTSFFGGLGDRPRHDGVLYRFPILGLLSLGIAAVALGVAREAIDALTALATAKRPAGSKKSLAHRELVQAHVAEAEGLVRSARALLFEATGEATEIAAAHGAVTARGRALLRLAATQATRASARAVDLMYHAGGGSSIYAQSPLQRHFRDIHVATQHVMVAEATYALVGRALLGLSSDAGML
jgi:indole-3-acetate monooxygenase